MDPCLVSVIRSAHAFGETEEEPEWSYGYIDSTTDGRLALTSSKDSTQKINLVLQYDEDNDDFVNLGDLYHIKRYHILDEDLSYKEESGDKIILHCTYMFCCVKDLASILPAQLRSPTLYLEELPSMHKVSHFLTQSPNLRLDPDKMNVILYVLDIQHTTANFDAKGKIYFESYVRAIRYHLGYCNKRQRVVPAPETMTFVLSSTKKSLKDLAHLRVGRLVGLVDIDKTQKFVPHSALHNLSSLSLPDVYNLEHGKYKFVKIVSQTSHGCIGLEAVKTEVGSPSPLPPQPRVFQVSEVIHASRDADHGLGDISMVHLEDGLYESLFSVQGVVVIKEFRERRDLEGISSQHARHLFEDFHVGTGRADRTLFIRLRQIDGLDTLDIYFDITRQSYPLGIVPGFLVTFHHLARRKANNILGYYCLGLRCTTVEVCSYLDNEDILTEQIPSRYLGEILEQDGEANRGLMAKMTCEVESVLMMSLRWQCIDCGSVVSRSACLGGCQNARRLFLANAVVVISDGSAEAHAILDEEELVFKLLMVSPKQIDAIKEVVLDSGTIACGYWTAGDDWLTEERPSSINGLTLEEMCNRVRRTVKFRIFGRALTRQKELTDNGDLLQKLGYKILDLTYETETLRTIVPKEPLKIKVSAIEYVDPLTAIQESLHSLEE
ncbi:CST complex subunit ctc1 [Apophysomyces sp. BC1034]|nr:CST complex subunit ctc1 [Apophysomyces sp. BC1015]KAG0189361.1 CST complex subunit ctc1 [Apophysomyces sp. BC1034]